MSTQKNDDINQLVDQAQNALRQGARDSLRPNARKPFARAGWSGMAWLAAIALWGWHLWPQGPNDAEIGRELALLVGEARDSVERYLRENQALPAQLPAPALSLVISYQVIDPSATPPLYALDGRIGHVSQHWTNATVSGGTQ
jgi:hypothetical protein